MSNIVLASKNPATMTHEEMLAFVKAKPDEAAGVMRALVALNTTALPDTAFVKRGRDGMLRKISVRVTLSEEMREVVKIPGRDVYNKETREWETGPPSYDLAAIGLRRLNQTAGLHCITPDYVVVAGKRQPNPFIETDEVYRRPRRVYVRRVVIGPAMATGNLVASDITLVLDLELYILENLLKKLSYAGKPPWRNKNDKDNKREDAVTPEERAKRLGQWGEAGKKPADEGAWRFYSINDDVGVWFNLMHPDFQKCMSEHVQRCKFADRIAQTLAERNAMKAHPGMPASIAADENGRIRVPMVAWTSNITAEQLEQFREMVNAGTLQEQMEVKSEEHRAERVEDLQAADVHEVVQVAAQEGVHEHEDAAGDDVQEAETRPVAEKGEKAGADKADKAGPPAADEAPDPAARQKLVERAVEVHGELMETIGKKKLTEAMSKLGITGKAQVNPSEATDAQLNALIALKEKL